MRGKWDDLQARLRSGALSRRDFLVAAAALGVTGGLATGALAQTPKRGGHLMVGIDQGESDDSLDPATWGADYNYASGHMIFDTLTYADAQFKLQPWLATSWDSKDLKVWVFKIRKGVTFHNGKTLTPADVVYSLSHHRIPTSRGKSMVSAVTDVAATGPDEVTFTLNSPNADFPYNLAEFHMMIMPDGEKYDAGIGTGAFKLEAFQPGVTTKASRNTNDWNQDRGYVDSVEMLLVNDPTARIQGLLGGALHIVNRLPPNAIKPLENNPSFRIFSAAGGNHTTFVMTSNKPPYDNLDLRLAMKYAIDREEVLKTVFRGYGKIANDHPIPTHLPFYAADIPQHAYDPDKAKFHFKKSGFDGPVVLVVADAAGGSVEMAQVFKANAAKAGIEVSIDRAGNDGYWTKYWRVAPFFASTFGGRATADIALSIEFSPTSPFCECQWVEPKFDPLLVAARAETDQAKRAQMYGEAQMMVHDGAGTVLPIFNNAIEAATSKVNGFTPSPVQQYAAWRGTEQIWLSDA